MSEKIKMFMQTPDGKLVDITSLSEEKGSPELVQLYEEALAVNKQLEQELTKYKNSQDEMEESVMIANNNFYDLFELYKRAKYKLCSKDCSQMSCENCPYDKSLWLEYWEDKSFEIPKEEEND